MAAAKGAKFYYSVVFIILFIYTKNRYMLQKLDKHKTDECNNGLCILGCNDLNNEIE